MAHPALLLGGGLLGGVLGYKYFTDKATAKKVEQQAASQLTQAVAKELVAGKTYNLLCQLVTKEMQLAAGSPEQKRAQASSMLQGLLQQLGFRVLSTPALRNAAEGAKFDKNEAVTWVAVATWTRSDLRTITAIPSPWDKWVGMILPYEMPAV